MNTDSTRMQTDLVSSSHGLPATAACLALFMVYRKHTHMRVGMPRALASVVAAATSSISGLCTLDSSDVQDVYNRYRVVLIIIHCDTRGSA